MQWNELLRSTKRLALLIITIWATFALQFVLPPITYLGIVPRSQTGLIGVVCSPWLHGSLQHITANSLAIASIGILFCLSYAKHFLQLTSALILLSGLLTWAIGPSRTLIIGASGYTYALLGFMIFMGMMSRSFKNIFFSIVVVLLHGGAVFGLLPSQPGVSWQAHVAGFFAGLIVARVYSKRVHH
ncbi:MAG: rhomboid family intramembrane serine protease [Bdellovibrionales bacterium]|nr:rhomboid family intramembrane serine protease [Bdellovibrionales bacterium]